MVDLYNLPISRSPPDAAALTVGDATIEPVTPLTCQALKAKALLQLVTPTRH